MEQVTDYISATSAFDQLPGSIPESNIPKPLLEVIQNLQAALLRQSFGDARPQAAEGEDVLGRISDLEEENARLYALLCTGNYQTMTAKQERFQKRVNELELIIEDYKLVVQELEEDAETFFAMAKNARRTSVDKNPIRSESRSLKRSRSPETSQPHQRRTAGRDLPSADTSSRSRPQIKTEASTSAQEVRPLERSVYKRSPERSERSFKEGSIAAESRLASGMDKAGTRRKRSRSPSPSAASMKERRISKIDEDSAGQVADSSQAPQVQDLSSTAKAAPTDADARKAQQTAIWQAEVAARERDRERRRTKSKPAPGYANGTSSKTEQATESATQASHRQQSESRRKEHYDRPDSRPDKKSYEREREFPRESSRGHEKRDDRQRLSIRGTYTRDDRKRDERH